MQETKMLLGFEWWSCDTGSVQIDGTDVLNVTLEWREFVPEDAEYDPGLTIEQKDALFERVLAALTREFSAREDN